MITDEQKFLIKKLFDNYSSHVKSLEEDTDPEESYETILENLILVCRLNAITEVLDILELEYEVDDGIINFK